MSRQILQDSHVISLTNRRCIIVIGSPLDYRAIYTVAQSWAALRKAWNAFKIAHSNGNLDLMRKYAKVIRKLQLQMGIQLLPFDEDILDEQTDYELFIQNFDLECQWREENQVTEEKAPDYDHMMDKIDLPPNIPEPSDTIFVRRLEKLLSPVENSAPKLIVQKSTTYNEKSCPVGPQSMHVRTKVRVTKQTINYQSSCPIESSQDSPAEDELFEESEPGYEKQSPSDPEDSNDIFSNWGQSHVVHEDNSCLYEPADEQPSHIVHEDNSCLYEPADEQPSHVVHEDNSCLYEPAEQDRQHMNNERDLERKRKSNFYKTDS